MNKTILITAVILGIVSIVLGAFAAHGLKKVITPEAINTFETGVKYQMYHALFYYLLVRLRMYQKVIEKLFFTWSLLVSFYFLALFMDWQQTLYQVSTLKKLDL